MESVINLRKFENDALKVRLVKILNYCWSAHYHCVCCCIPRNSAKLHGIVEILGKPTEIATIEIFDKTHGLRFLKVSHLFFLICVKKKQKKNTLHLYSMCGGIKTLKHNVCISLTTAIKISHIRTKHVT